MKRTQRRYLSRRRPVKTRDLQLCACLRAYMETTPELTLAVIQAGIKRGLPMCASDHGATPDWLVDP
jgi:hypothetical protein